MLLSKLDIDNEKLKVEFATSFEDIEIGKHFLLLDRGQEFKGKRYLYSARTRLYKKVKQKVDGNEGTIWATEKSRIADSVVVEIGVMNAIKDHKKFLVIEDKDKELFLEGELYTSYSMELIEVSPKTLEIMKSVRGCVMKNLSLLKPSSIASGVKTASELASWLRNK